jgi:hypothetical protein
MVMEDFVNEDILVKDGIAYVAKDRPVGDYCAFCAFCEEYSCSRMPSCIAIKRQDKRNIIWVRKLR